MSIRRGMARRSVGGTLGESAPLATQALYTDTTAITATGENVTAWGIATSVTGTPKVVTDTVTPNRIIQFFSGGTITVPAGAFNFLSQNASTLIVVFRERKWDPRNVKSIVDSTAGGTTRGFQLQATNDSTNVGRYRKLRARIHDGSSFVVDEPPAVGFYNNNYISGKWVIAAITTSTTRCTLQVDGETAYDIVESFAYSASAPSNFVIGGADIDIQCVWAFNGVLSDTLRDSKVVELAARFNVQLISQVVGSPTTAHYNAFPSVTTLPTGALACCYRSGLNHSGDVGTIEMKTSTTRGIVWGNARTIQSDVTFDSRDACFSRQLANGDFLINYFLQTLGANGHETSWVRRSSDSLATFSAPIQVTVGVVMGTTGFEACSAPIVQLTNGKLLFPLYGKNDGEAFTSAWFVFSTDNGVTWLTNVKVANGIADSIAYAEPCVIQIRIAHQGLNVGDLFAIIRDDTNSHMWETISTNNGTSWSALVSIPGAKSSGRSLTQLASGEIQWVGRPNDPQAAVLTRLSAGNWSIPQVAPALGVVDAGMTNGDVAETSSGVLSFVYGREELAFGPGAGPGTADIVCRPDYPEWQLRANLPIVVLPLSAGVLASGTQQITVRGAAPFTYSMNTSGSGSPSVSAAGLYTAGSSNGVDIVNVIDCNGQTILVTFTVTGGASVVPPTSIDVGNLTAWWDPSQGKALDGGGKIATWTSVDGAARVLTGGGVTPPSPATSLNGKSSIDFDGVSSEMGGAFVINTLVGASSWTIGFNFKDAGSPADTGNDFVNADIIGSVNDGFFALGTTATQVFAGQDNAGAGTPYEIVAAAAATAHYAVVHYNAGTGKISISIDGGAFSAGTSVTALGVSVTSLKVGRSGVLAVFFKGALGDIAIWKSLLAGSDLSNIQGYLASKL